MKGSNSSFIAQGHTHAVFATVEPSLGTSPNISVGASNIYDDEIYLVPVWKNYYDSVSTYLCENVAHVDPPARHIQFAEAVSFATTSLGEGLINTPYSEFVALNGEPFNLSWDVQRGSQLPPGLELDRSTGEIHGTPTQAGTWNFVVRAGNYPFSSVTQEFALIIQDIVSPTPPTPPTPYDPATPSIDG